MFGYEWIWNCGARNCPTHSGPEHNCPTGSQREHRFLNGKWYCRRVQPPCPGHSSKDHRCMTKYWKLLLPGMSANRAYKIHTYPSVLQANKSRLHQAFNASGTREEWRVLMMAMAMIETRTMAPSERDATKDTRTDGAANASIFNLSEDMLRRLGYRGSIHILDPLGRLPDMVRLIALGINRWGIDRMLNFVRGGYTAFNDGVSYGAADYRNAVATILKVIDIYPSLMFDRRRVEINVPHV